MNENWINLTLSRKLNGLGPGIVRVRAGRDGLAKERYWRDRIKDGLTDHCCVVIPPKPKAAKTGGPKLPKEMKGDSDG